MVRIKTVQIFLLVLRSEKHLLGYLLAANIPADGILGEMNLGRSSEGGSATQVTRNVCLGWLALSRCESVKVYVHVAARVSRVWQFVQP